MLFCPSCAGFCTATRSRSCPRDCSTDWFPCSCCKYRLHRPLCSVYLCECVTCVSSRQKTMKRFAQSTREIWTVRETLCCFEKPGLKFCSCSFFRTELKFCVSVSVNENMKSQKLISQSSKQTTDVFFNLTPNAASHCCFYVCSVL